ncbi:septum formation family protein [Micromonospora sp. LOL_013]|uniref:septum formation family protein n=1 Tax=unclassified Micromonospora TaxID=2617518 RepID=UPI003A857B6F
MARRWDARARLVALLTAASLTTTAGCVPPSPGVDGDLVDNWAAFDEPVHLTPEAGSCHNDSRRFIAWESYRPVGCVRYHLVETVHVGTLGDDPAVPFDEDGAADGLIAARRAARPECDRRVNEFLGGPWQTARLRMTVVTPSDAAWTGGARWFGCDVGVVDSPGGPLVDWYGTVEGALQAPGHPLLLTCYDSAAVGVDDEPLTEPLDCDTPHQAEFAGTYVEDKLGYDEVELNDERVHTQCRKVVADYAKVPNNGDLQYRVGTIYTFSDVLDWAEGDRTIRCFAWRADPLLTGSVRDGGTSALPIQYQ